MGLLLRPVRPSSANKISPHRNKTKKCNTIQGVHLKEGEISWVCSTHGKGEKYTKNFSRKTGREDITSETKV
jgi:hypothetical protein